MYKNSGPTGLDWCRQTYFINHIQTWLIHFNYYKKGKEANRNNFIRLYKIVYLDILYLCISLTKAHNKLLKH